MLHQPDARILSFAIQVIRKGRKRKMFGFDTLIVRFELLAQYIFPAVHAKPCSLESMEDLFAIIQ